ncbi:MAG: hypothetical protein ACRKFN_11500 [Desulfitobacterium sp.]
MERANKTGTWRDVFEVFATLDESERISLLQQIKSECGILPRLTEFIIHNLENPDHARAMVHAIDYGLVDLPALRTSIERSKVSDKALA